MSIISVQGITKSYGGRLIIGPITWTIADGARIGLVGANGAGKSTLLRMVALWEPYDDGTIVKRKGLRSSYLPQEVPGDDQSVLATVLAQRQDIAELEAQLQMLDQQLADPAIALDSARLQAILDHHEKVLERYDELGGPSIRNSAGAHLRALGILDDTWDMPTRQLSGGQRKLVALAGCLLQQPDVLLLDEPDTHLDLPHKALLEALIREFEGAVVLISHDRYLLDETVTEIVELEDRQLQVWEGNYSAFAVAKEIALLRQQELFTAQQKEIAALQAAIARFKLWASIVVNERHARQARNKQRQIDRMDKVDRPVLQRKQMSLHLRPTQRGGQKAFELRDTGFAFGDHLILLGLEHTILRGERIGIVGPNGAGKTILGRLLAEQLQPSYGEIWRGPSVEVGYYAQGSETLDPEATLVECIRAVKPMYEEQAVAFLGSFLFPYRVVTQTVATLSGGERSRLQLARLMLQGANCLILDEPTNHLDIASAEVLETALSTYTGTVIVISHDRYFLDRVVDRIIEVEDGGISTYLGGFSAYLEEKARRIAAALAAQHAREEQSRQRQRIPAGRRS